MKSNLLKIVCLDCFFEMHCEEIIQDLGVHIILGHRIEGFIYIIFTGFVSHSIARSDDGAVAEQ